MKSAKAVIAALGGTLTALMVVLATVSIAAQDDVFDAGEIGSITTAVMTFALTVYAVWRVPNAGMVDEAELRAEMLAPGKMPGRRV
jgi:hypothetical protein